MKRLLQVVLFLVTILLIVGIFSSNFLSEKTFFLIQESVTINPTPTLVPTLTLIPTPDIVEIKISTIGDCTIGFDSSKIDSKFSYLSKGSDLSYYFKNVVNILSKDDLTIANCEGTFTTSNEERQKTDNPAYHFKGPPQYAEVFKLGSVEYVNLANNHTYDFGKQGYLDTKASLDNFNIQYFNKDEVTFFKKDDITIALLGYNFLCGDYQTQAKEIIADIKDLSTKSDIQIVSLHWGFQKSNIPISGQINAAHFLIDNGVDLILGHHPHVLQPIEVYKGKTIVYSLGNFSYGGSLYSKPETFIYQQTFKFIDHQLISNNWNVVPCLMYSEKTNNYQPIIADGAKAQEILDFLTN